MRLAALLAFLTLASPGLAQEGEPWEEMRGADSAELSARGWRQVGAVNLSSDEDVHKVMTFWEVELGATWITARCVTSFGQDNKQVMDYCEWPRSRPHSEWPESRPRP